MGDLVKFRRNQEHAVPSTEELFRITRSRDSHNSTFIFSLSKKCISPPPANFHDLSCFPVVLPIFLEVFERIQRINYTPKGIKINVDTALHPPFLVERHTAEPAACCSVDSSSFISDEYLMKYKLILFRILINNAAKPLHVLEY